MYKSWLISLRSRWVAGIPVSTSLRAASSEIRCSRTVSVRGNIGLSVHSARGAAKARIIGLSSIGLALIPLRPEIPGNSGSTYCSKASQLRPVPVSSRLTGIVRAISPANGFATPSCTSPTLDSAHSTGGNEAI